MVFSIIWIPSAFCIKDCIVRAVHNTEGLINETVWHADAKMSLHVTGHYSSLPHSLKKSGILADVLWKLKHDSDSLRKAIFTMIEGKTH